MLINSSEVNQWLQGVEAHRNKLDLATIVWFWMRLENTDSWESIEQEFYDVAEDLLDLSYKGFSLRRIWSKQSRSFKGFERSIEMTKDEKWFCDYRDAIGGVTPFSDEEIYSEHTIFKLGDEWDPSKYYSHPVLSNRNLTTCFIDLDLFIDRMRINNRYFPVQFLPKGFSDGSNNYELYTSRAAEGDANNPFRLYGLISDVKKFLWSGDDEAGELLKRLTADYSSKEFKCLLAKIYRITPTQANYLRIYTQPVVDRLQGNSNQPLNKMLRPLMKVMLYDEDVAEKFWALKTHDYKGLDALLQIEESERKVLMAIAKPRAYIVSGKKARFENHGNTKPEVIASSARQLVEVDLSELKGQFRDLKELDYYGKLRAFLLKR